MFWQLTGAAAAAGAVVTAYAFAETRQFEIREAEVPILPPGAAPIRVLHLSDIHLTPGQRRKREWLRSLIGLDPDLVVNTGDNLAHPGVIPALVEAFEDLLRIPGVFVRGSNDYFGPTLRNPFWYLKADDGTRNTHGAPMPTLEMTDRFTRAGWLDLDNATGVLDIKGIAFGFTGVDDPHLEYDDLHAVRGGADQATDVRLGVTHAPYLRVLNQFAGDGHDLILAGHTHGGQVCLPGGRALVTNCDLDTGRAKGLSRHPAEAPIGAPGASWLHVSAGVGTSPFTPVRLFCRPEATLLTLVPRPDF